MVLSIWNTYLAVYLSSHTFKGPIGTQFMKLVSCTGLVRTYGSANVYITLRLE